MPTKDPLSRYSKHQRSKYKKFVATFEDGHMFESNDKTEFTEYVNKYNKVLLKLKKAKDD